MKRKAAGVTTAKQKARWLRRRKSREAKAVFKAMRREIEPITIAEYAQSTWHRHEDSRDVGQSWYAAMRDHVQKCDRQRHDAYASALIKKAKG
jgi:hypothetical protein